MKISSKLLLADDVKRTKENDDIMKETLFAEMTLKKNCENKNLS